MTLSSMYNQTPHHIWDQGPSKAQLQADQWFGYYVQILNPWPIRTRISITKWTKRGGKIVQSEDPIKNLTSTKCALALLETIS